MVMENNNEYKTINIDGTEYETNIPDSFLSRKKWQPPNEKQILSHIPGKILAINVKVGEKVKKGQALFLLEAMKMKNEVVAPFSGTIKSIHVSEDEAVPKSYLLLEFA